MIADLFKPQNRFKPKAKPAKGARRWGARLRAIDWKQQLRRVAVIGILAASLTGLSLILDRPIRHLSIDGSFQRVSPGQVEQAAAPYLKAGFMSADLDGVQRAVEGIAWVDHARVQRRWPNSVHVTIVEQVAAARWGESGLLNARGELFVRTATHVPPELPRLSGPEGSEGEVARRYLSAQGKMLEAGMRIAAVRMDERGAWEFDLDNGLTIRLGRSQVDERLDRFIRTASMVVSRRANEIAYVDMRYSNGFTIGWRTQAPDSGATPAVAGAPAGGATPADATPPMSARVQHSDAQD